MNLNLFAMLGWPEIIGILIIVLILFGAKRVPELMRGLGSGIKEFKKASREVQDELQRAIDEEPPADSTRRGPTAPPSEHASTESTVASEAEPTSKA